MQLIPDDEYLARSDDLFARAVQIGIAAPRKTPAHLQVLNLIYWFLVFCFVIWVTSMAIDREMPITWVKRDIVNPEHKVEQNAKIMLASGRTRSRSCPLTKRQWIIDGIGRRHDFEAERFDAYGPVTGDKPEYDVTGPTVPIDAAPGRGRLGTSFAWYCNMLQRAIEWPITYVPPLMEFEIIPRPTSN